MSRLFVKVELIRNDVVLLRFSLVILQNHRALALADLSHLKGACVK